MFTKAARLALIFAVVPAASVFAEDLKVKTIHHMTVHGLRLGREVTVYVHGAAQRVEYLGFAADFPGPRKYPVPHSVVITRCDIRMVYLLDINSQEYVEAKLDKFPSQDQLAKQGNRERKEGQKYFQSNTVDTGETRDFYGHTAKHLVTTIKGKGGQISDYEVVDGWYLDLAQPGCAPEYMRQHQGHLEIATQWSEGAHLDNDAPVTTALPGITGLHGVDPYGYSSSNGSGSIFAGMRPGFVPMINSGIRSGFVYNWVLPGGLAVQETSTELVRDMLTEQKVIEFSEEPLDPSLFEVPAAFKKVRALYQHSK
ncbi:MAG TPA: hypothetical protein VN176_12175 [Verrucomicrobiae bacterium]|jgi:hypothetical protein|nr:hypothetical protein [Verrucomicrobiae bacterium]